MRKRKSLLTTGLVTLSLFSQHFAWAQSKVERPPQFVLLTFDGSYNNDVWQYSRDYTKAKKAQGIDTRFTFFINNVYLLTEDPASNRHYDAPTIAAGKKQTAIGWGDNNKDVQLRVDQMNEAFREGHEIASHTVGHWNGQDWSVESWTSEFRQFDDILKNLFSYNNMGPTPLGYNRVLFDKDITGFRAPQLGFNTNLYKVLPKFGITYDTSQITETENYWPRKNPAGHWNFPLAQVKEPGGARRWVSMDYNFCMRDSARILSLGEGAAMKYSYVDAKGKTVVNKSYQKECLFAVTEAQKKEVKNNMMNIYRSYFNNNYYGNRAPIHIGHHFSSWMRGAYLEAFFQFADEVCAKPEVKCVTYQELQKFMDDKSNSQINAYQEGAFSKLPRPKSATLARHLDIQIKMKVQDDEMNIDLEGRDAKMEGLTKNITFAGQTREFAGNLDLATVRKQVKMGEDTTVRIAIKDRLEKEIATATYKIINVGTSEEKVDSKNLENEWMKGDMIGAHRDEKENGHEH